MTESRELYFRAADVPVHAPGYPDFVKATIYDPAAVALTQDPHIKPQEFLRNLFPYGHNETSLAKFDSNRRIQTIFDLLHLGYDLFSTGGVRDILAVFQMPKPKSLLLLEDLTRCSKVLLNE